MTTLAELRDEALAQNTLARARAQALKDAADTFVAASLAADAEMNALVSGDPEAIAARHERRQAYEDAAQAVYYVQAPVFGATTDTVIAAYTAMCDAIE
jgi:hypothetical protein